MNNNSTYVFVRNDFDGGSIKMIEPVSLLDEIDETLEKVLTHMEAKLPRISDRAIKNILDFAGCR